MVLKNKKVFIPLFVVVIILIGIVYKLNTSTTSSEVSPVKPVMVSDISHRAYDVPMPLIFVREENKKVVVNLTATQVVAEIDDGITYEYWTFNSQAPGPFIRVKEGDAVEVHLTHSHEHVGADNVEHSFTVNPFVPLVLAQSDHEHAPGTPEEHEEEMDMEMDMEGMTAEEHAVAGHGEHSIDLHAVVGPGGGAEVMRAAPDETKVFQFKATRPGIYLYHCGSPHVPTHIANGMYGLILVEPKEGLPPVDKEFYVMQGELYTTGKLGDKGHQEFSKAKLLNEDPEYFVFNGRVGALTGEGALTANVGETVRIFFGNSGQVPSSFHIIGGVFDKLYAHGDIISPPRQNVQTTLVPAGSATMMEMKLEVPGKLLLVDHSLTRSIDKGALGELIVKGEEKPEIYKGIE